MAQPDVNQLLDQLKQQEIDREPASQDEWIVKLRAEAGETTPSSPRKTVPASSPVPWNNGDLARMLPESEYPVNPNVPIKPYSYTPPVGSALDEFSLGLNSGLQGLARVPNAAIAMGGNLIKRASRDLQVGEGAGQAIEDFGRTGMDYWQPDPVYAPRVGKIEDVQSAKDLLDYLAYGVGSNVPQIATSIASGGVGAMAGKAVAQRMIPEAFSRFAAPAAVASARKMIGGGAMAGVGLSGTAMENEQIASMQLEQNKELDAFRALPFAALAGATEIIPLFSLLHRTGIGSRILSKLGVESAEQAVMRGPGFVPLVKTILSQGLKQAPIGAGQEAIQTELERAGVEGLSLIDKTAGSDVLNAVVQGGFLEFLTGGMGGSAVPVRPGMQKSGATLADIFGINTPAAEPLPPATPPAGVPAVVDPNENLRFMGTRENAPVPLTALPEPSNMLPAPDALGNLISYPGSGIIPPAEPLAGGKQSWFGYPNGADETKQPIDLTKPSSPLAATQPASSTIDNNSYYSPLGRPLTDQVTDQVKEATPLESSVPIDISTKTPKVQKIGKVVDASSQWADQISRTTTAIVDTHPFTGELIVKDINPEVAPQMKQLGALLKSDGTWVVPPSKGKDLSDLLQTSMPIPEATSSLMDAAEGSLNRVERRRADYPLGTDQADRRIPNIPNAAQTLAMPQAISNEEYQARLAESQAEAIPSAPIANSEQASPIPQESQTTPATPATAESQTAKMNRILKDTGVLAARKEGPQEGLVETGIIPPTAIHRSFLQNLKKLLGAGDKLSGGQVIDEQPESRSDIGARRNSGFGEAVSVPGFTKSVVEKLSTYTPELRGVTEPEKIIMSRNEAFRSTGRTAYRYDISNHYDADRDVLGLWKQTAAIHKENPHAHPGVLFSNLVKKQGYSGYVFNAEKTGQERWAATFTPVKVKENLGRMAAKPGATEEENKQSQSKQADDDIIQAQKMGIKFDGEMMLHQQFTYPDGKTFLKTPYETFDAFLQRTATPEFLGQMAAQPVQDVQDAQAGPTGEVPTDQNTLVSTDGNPITHEQLESWADVIGPKLPEGVSIKIARDTSELPPSFHTLYGEMNQNSIPFGYMDPSTKTCYLLSPAVTTDKIANQILAHELITHHSLREMLGEEKFNKTLKEIYRSTMRDPEAFKSMMGLNRGLYDFNTQNPSERLALANEFVAKISETSENPNWFQSIISDIRAWLRNMGIDVTWTDQDIRALLRQSSDYLFSTPQSSKSDQSGGQLSIKVFHGTGSMFRKFDFNKIGSESGQMAYGWGAYVSDIEGVGLYYAEKAGKYSIKGKGYVGTFIIHKGKDPSAYQFLDWNTPVDPKLIVDLRSDLTPDQQVRFDQTMEHYAKGVDGDRGAIVYSALRTALYDQNKEEAIASNNYYRAKVDSAKLTSLYLVDHGITGMRYPAGKKLGDIHYGTTVGHDYVIYDEKALDIKKFRKTYQRKQANLMIRHAKGTLLANVLQENLTPATPPSDLQYFANGKALPSLKDLPENPHVYTLWKAVHAVVRAAQVHNMDNITFSREYVEGLLSKMPELKTVEKAAWTDLQNFYASNMGTLAEPKKITITTEPVKPSGMFAIRTPISKNNDFWQLQAKPYWLSSVAKVNELGREILPLIRQYRPEIMRQSDLLRANIQKIIDTKIRTMPDPGPDTLKTIGTGQTMELARKSGAIFKEFKKEVDIWEQFISDAIIKYSWSPTKETPSLIKEGHVWLVDGKAMPVFDDKIENYRYIRNVKASINGLLKKMWEGKTTRSELKLMRINIEKQLKAQGLGKGTWFKTTMETALKPLDQLNDFYKTIGLRQDSRDINIEPAPPAPPASPKGAMAVRDNGGRLMIRQGKPPKGPTQKSYKLFRTLKTRPGEIFTLFIGNKESIPLNTWLTAEPLPTAGYADRPGWHTASRPSAPHLSESNRVWAEVEIPSTVEDRVPGKPPSQNNQYTYAVPKAQGGEWIISGSIKINKLLTPEEVKQILSGSLAVRNDLNGTMTQPNDRWYSQPLTLSDRFKESLSAVKSWWTENITPQLQHFKDINYKNPAHLPIVEYLRQAEEIPRYARELVGRFSQRLLRVLKKPQDRDTFEHIIILKDMLREATIGVVFQKGPQQVTDMLQAQGYSSIQQLRDHIAHFESLITPAVQEALDARQKFWDRWRQNAVNIDILPQSVLSNDDYFHHQVKQWEAINEDFRGTAPGMHKTKKSFQKGRTGFAGEYNLNYFASETGVLVDLITQVNTAKSLESIRNNSKINVLPALVAEADRLNAAAPAGATKETWKTVLKSGLLLDQFGQPITEQLYDFYKPVRGNFFHKVLTLTERSIRKVREEMLNVIGPDPTIDELMDIARIHAGTAMATGLRQPITDNYMVINRDIIQAMENFQKQTDPTFLGKMTSYLQAQWKRWVLFNPFRVVRYLLNNTTGDADIAFAFRPAIFKEIPSAYKMLYAWAYKDSAGLTNAQRNTLETLNRKGLLGSGITVQEIPELSDSSLQQLINNPSPQLIKRWFKGVHKFNNFRENIMRLATWQYMNTEASAGRFADLHYAASHKNEIDAIDNMDDKIIKMARELIGDYGNLSYVGQNLRKYIIPFWSWTEINAPRYFKMMANELRAGNTAGGLKVAGVLGAKAAVRAASFAILVMAWNFAFFRDEEEEMRRLGRDQLHLMLGRRDDGSVISLRVQGSFSDTMGWLGAENLLEELRSLYKGRVTVKEELTSIAKAPIKRLIGGATPLYKTTAEAMTGKTLFPDPFSPRPIRDKFQHLMKGIGMDWITDRWISHKPAPPLFSLKTIATPFLYITDTHEAAYFHSIKMANDWLKDQGLERTTSEPTNRSNALYYWKQASKLKDKEGESYYKALYLKLGGKPAGMSQSIKHTDPLVVIPLKLRSKFLSSLGEDNKQTWKMGVSWWQKTFKGMNVESTP